jgi:1-acyl-sn-glycerol-3-phosphate acyltransferase
MAQLIQFPIKAAARAGSAIVEPLRGAWPIQSVDDFGRDPHLIEALAPFTHLRWSVTVGGEAHLPARTGALLVCNNRRFSLSAVYAAIALSEVLDRPVRFVGRPDIAPIGAFMRRIGGLLATPAEVLGALRHHELVIISAAGTQHPRNAGKVPHELVGPAVIAGVPVLPVATMSSTIGRAARVEVGAPVRPRHKRRGPLAEVELAEQVQHHLQHMLDGFGGVQTGVAPIDWLAEG